MIKNKKLIENLRIFRQIAGISQEYMGIKLGISHTAYAKIETGKTPFSTKYRQKCCDIIGIEFETLKTFDKSVYYIN